jgi:hypothetical protein
MSYVIAGWKEGKAHAVIACPQSNKFLLIPLDSEAALTKIFSHPYRAGAQSILSWINSNDKQLAGEELSIQDEARFRK